MIVFASRTGNVKNIVGRLDKSIPTIDLNEISVIEQPYFLLTYTDGFGETPDEVMNFLNHSETNRTNLKGVIASGNINFGLNYCGCADEISRWLNVPIIKKIDLRGNSEDITTINRSYNKLIAGGTS